MYTDEQERVPFLPPFKIGSLAHKGEREQLFFIRQPAVTTQLEKRPSVSLSLSHTHTLSLLCKVGHPLLFSDAYISITEGREVRGKKGVTVQHEQKEVS